MLFANSEHVNAP